MNCIRLNSVILLCLFLHFCVKAQVCYDSVQFYSLYSSNRIEHIGGSFIQLQNGYAANTALVYTPAGRKPSIIVTNKDGQLVQAKYLEVADPTYSLKLANIIESPGNGMIVYGRLLTPNGNEKGVVVVKFDSNLVLQWSILVRRNISEPETASYNIWGLHCDEQSNIFFSFYSTPGGTIVPPTVFFVSLDGEGSLRWSKGIDDRVVPASSFSLNAITSVDNKALFIGNYQNNDKPGMVGLSVDRNTGSFIKMSSAVLNSPGNVAISYQDQNIRLWPRAKDFYYAFGEDVYSPKKNNIIQVLVDTGFTISQARRIKGTIWAYSWRQFNLAKNGSISFLGHDDPLATNFTTNHFAVLDSAGNIKINKKAGDNLFSNPDLYPAIFSSDGQSLSLSVSNRPNFDSVKRINLPLDGDSSLYSCLGKDTTFFSVEHTTLTSAVINPGNIYSNVVQLSSLALQASSFTAEKLEFCKVTSICNSLQISASSEFCTEMPQVFIARKNAGCLKKIRWNLDRIPASVVNQTDSSITLQFHTEWIGDIIASLEGCDLTASHPINVRKPLNSFSLGDDKVICSGDTIILSAPEGYKDYLWSTGETTSSIRVSNPSTVSVQSIDYCGNTFSSSLAVKTPSHIEPIISSTILCKGDSIFITLPDSISSILWNPSAIHLSNNNFAVLPHSSTTYIINARDQYDCDYSYQFTVKVNPCKNQVWFPNAFSPNGDNLNDTFGASIEGRLLSFSLAVYNRWGEQVFRSFNPSNKWDGKYKGSQATIGVYVWVCQYQFLNGGHTTTKGVVVLTR